MQAFTPIETFYRNDAYDGFAGNFHIEDYAEYVEFVKRHVGQNEVFEIGSGLGAAAFALFEAGVRVTATDIFPSLARKKFSELSVPIRVHELNAVKNHLPSESVPNYAMNEVLEHLENPDECFKECYRTLRPGGLLIIVSPNLISPLASAKAFLFALTRRWKTPYFKRTDGYTFPFGSTVLECFGMLLRNTLVTVQLHVFASCRRPRFRNPCLKKPALSDSDATFLTEPLTIQKMLKDCGFSLISFQENRRSATLAGSIWIVAQKFSDS